MHPRTRRSAMVVLLSSCGCRAASASAPATSDVQRAEAVARLRALQAEQPKIRSRWSTARDDLRRANECAGLPAGPRECGDHPHAQGLK